VKIEERISECLQIREITTGSMLDKLLSETESDNLKQCPQISFETSRHKIKSYCWRAMPKMS
jgi:hypothetical protein